jgi:hypothetical protein
MDNEYTRPSIVELGTVAELTLQDKDFSGDDGFTLMGQTIGDAS